MAPSPINSHPSSRWHQSHLLQILHSLILKIPPNPILTSKPQILMGPIRSLAFTILLSSVALTFAILLLLADITSLVAGDAGPVACDTFSAAPTANSSDLEAAFRDLVAANYLAAGDCALCVGPGSSAAASVMRRIGIRSAVRSSATACCGLPFDADSFDFAFTASLHRVRVPSRVVLEMERIIRPGRVGVVLRIGPGSIRPAPHDLMKAAAPVVSLLRFSDVIGARAGNGSAMVVFRKRGPSPMDTTSHRFKRNYDGMLKMPLTDQRAAAVCSSCRRVKTRVFGWTGLFYSKLAALQGARLRQP